MLPQVYPPRVRSTSVVLVCLYTARPEFIHFDSKWTTTPGWAPWWCCGGPGHEGREALAPGARRTQSVQRICRYFASSTQVTDIQCAYAYDQLRGMESEGRLSLLLALWGIPSMLRAHTTCPPSPYIPQPILTALSHAMPHSPSTTLLDPPGAEVGDLVCRDEP